ncbi:MAG: globin family protein [Pseudomonadota bacterium]
MTPQQIKLVRDTWQLVLPIADQAARLFYSRLFAIAPQAAVLFGGTDMDKQRSKLLGALGLAVQNADRLDEIAPALEDMGRRHVGYGARDEHYDVVGSALLWTLEQGLQGAFTDDVRTAWTELYGQVSGPMRRAASEQMRPAA